MAPERATGTRRACLCIEYDGSRYHGWQIQHHSDSVQAEVERALAHVIASTVPVVCAGRTDTGVHASGQIVHFDAAVERSERSLVLGTNSHLPDDISVRWACHVGPGFHARFAAVERRYRYLLLSAPARSALYANRAWCQPHRLDLASMRTAAAALVGEHDFSAFRAAGCQARHPVRDIRQLRVSQTGPWTVVDIAANAFLQHMVRNIVGLLWHIGSGQSPPDRAGQVLASGDRREGAVAAPAQGLYLTEVRYPGHFGLPQADESDSALLPLQPLVPLIA